MDESAAHIRRLERELIEAQQENSALRAGVRLESCVSGCCWTTDGHFRHHPWCVERMPSVQAMKNGWELERTGLERRAERLVLLEAAARRMVRIGVQIDEAATQDDTGRVVALVGEYQAAWRGVQDAVARLRGQHPDWPFDTVERVARAMFDADVRAAGAAADTAWAAEGRDRGLWHGRAVRALRALDAEEGE